MKNEQEIKENKEFAIGLLTSAIHTMARYNPEQLDSVLTDYNLELAMKDIDTKMSKSYTAYINNKNRTLLDPSEKGLAKALMQLNGAELLTHYILYELYNEIAQKRNLTFEMKSNIKDIKIIYNLDGPKLMKK